MTSQLEIVPAQQQPFYPPARRELLLPLVVEVHREHLTEHVVQPAALLQAVPHRPLPPSVVRGERVWESVVEPTGASVAEAEREDFEWGDGGCD